MPAEMSVIFLFAMASYFLASISYLVYFFSENEKVRAAARITLMMAGVIHTIYIAHRYFRAGFLIHGSVRETSRGIARLKAVLRRQNKASPPASRLDRPFARTLYPRVFRGGDSAAVAE